MVDKATVVPASKPASKAASGKPASKASKAPSLRWVSCFAPVSAAIAADTTDKRPRVGTDGSKTQSVLSLMARPAGASIADIKSVLDAAGGRQGQPVTAGYAKTWTNKSYVQVVYGYGVRKAVGSDGQPRYQLVAPAGQHGASALRYLRDVSPQYTSRADRMAATAAKRYATAVKAANVA